MLMAPLPVRRRTRNGTSVEYLMSMCETPASAPTLSPAATDTGSSTFLTVNTMSALLPATTVILAPSSVQPSREKMPFESGDATASGMTLAPVLSNGVFMKSTSCLAERK